jgi:hypothetical protein
MAIAFEAATEKAKQFLQDQRFSEGRDLYNAKDYRGTLLSDYSSRFFMDPAVRAAILNAYLDDFQGKAGELAEETLRHALASMIEAGEPMPEDLRMIAAEFLRGTAPRPRRKTGRKEISYLHSRIVWTIILLKAEGMSVTRNDASEPESACDAVAAALKDLRLRPTTYAAVKRIWLADHSFIEAAANVQKLI